jgi:hypothetical protein
MALADLSPDVGWKLAFVSIIAEFSLIGVIFAVWGLLRFRRTHFRPRAYQRLVRDLLMWRMLEEDPTGGYQRAEPLVIVWAHGQGLAAITSGAGMVAAGILASCAVLLVSLPAHPANTSSVFQTVLQPLLTLLLVALQLLMVGMLAGLILGYAWAFGWRENNPDIAPMRPRFGIGMYHASWLPWLVLAAVALETVALALSVPVAFWRESAAEFIVFFVLPAIAIVEIVALEGVARALCRMPLAQLPGPPEAADQRREQVYAFLVTVLFASQIAMLPLLAVSQYLACITFSSSTANGLPASFGYVFLLEVFGSMLLIGLLGKSGGRLGGRSTGWPWWPELGTEPA